MKKTLMIAALICAPMAALAMPVVGDVVGTTAAGATGAAGGAGLRVARVAAGCTLPSVLRFKNSACSWSSSSSVREPLGSISRTGFFICVHGRIARSNARQRNVRYRATRTRAERVLRTEVS